MSTISTTIASSVTLGSVTNFPGTYASPLTITSSGAVETSGNAVFGPATAAWTVVNQGTITSAGVNSKGIFLNSGGSVDNAGLIEASGGVFITGGSGMVTNSGTVGGASAKYGVVLFAGGSVENAGGLIEGTSNGIEFAGGGTIGTVTNSGTIMGTNGYGIFLIGGSVSNNAVIKGYGGVAISGSDAAVTNSGTIVGTGGDGVYLQAGGSVVNIAKGDIAGYIGVYSSGAGTITNSGTITGSGGIAVSFGGVGANLLALGSGYHLTGTVQGSSAVGATNTLELLGAAGQGVAVNYNGLSLTNFQDVLFGTAGNATLLVSNMTGTLPVTISGFDAASEIIDLTTIGTDGAISNNDTAAHRVTVAGSLGSVTLQLDASDSADFRVMSDGSSGTEVIACFCRGTLIRTDAGEVPVEVLSIGDSVITQSGEARRIKWIGRRAYDPRFVARNSAVLPVRIEGGALGDDVPSRDLLLSPEHALSLDGMLVPAHLLVNGATIRQVEAVERLEYFHIEFDTHDVIFADDAAAETYVDCENRSMFQNGHEFAALHPGDPTVAWQFCARRVEADSPELAVVRTQLLAHAEHSGRVSRDPDLQLIVDGAVVRPHSVEDHTRRFVVPAGARAVTIASRSTVPGETEAASRDKRRLGVAVEQIVLSGAGLRIAVAPDCPELRDGFHDDEGDHRWTNGLAALPSALVASFSGKFSIDVRTAATELRYPIDAERPLEQPAPTTQSHRALHKGGLRRRKG